MGQIVYRANLSAATYPMTIADGGRTVIMPGPDQNFDRRVDPTGAQKDAGIPQALYLENVMPTVSGYQSVGYRRFDSDMITGGNPIYKVLKVYGADGTFVSSNYIYQTSAFGIKCRNDGRGLVIGDLTWNTASNISSAVLKAESYFFASGVARLYTVYGGSNDLNFTDVTATVTPAGFLASAGIAHILTYANYLIAVSATGTVYWSSTTTPTDFVASLVSGSGSTNIADLRGIFVTAEVCSNGFYVYSTDGAIFAQYTGNARYPFKFTPVENFSGVELLPLMVTRQIVAGGVNFSGNVVVDKFGQIRYLERNTASELDAAISSYIGKATLQDSFSYATNTFSQVATNLLRSSVFVWQDRYVFISVNDPLQTDSSQYSHVIVFDNSLKRVGKLKVPHKFIVAFSDFSTRQGPGIGFVDAAAGVIRYLNFDIYNLAIAFMHCEAMTAVLVLGKFQYVRSRKIQLHEIELEGPQDSVIVASPNFSCAILPSQDGRNFDAPVTPYEVTKFSGLAIYTAHTTAQNISIAIKGAFNVSTLQLKFSPRGNR